MSQHVSVGTINAPAGYGDEAAETCWLKTSSHSDFFGMNEIGNKSIKDDLENLRREKKHGRFGLYLGPNPVFWDLKKYKSVRKARHIQIHPAATGFLARRFPGYNGARYLTEEVIKPVSGGLQVAHLHTHWVPRGVKVSAWWRNKMRRISKDLLRKLVKAHRAAGRIVVVTGDLNIKGPFEVVSGFVWLVSAGVDKIGAIAPVGYRIINRKMGSFPAPTDHKRGWWASFDVVKVAS